MQGTSNRAPGVPLAPGSLRTRERKPQKAKAPVQEASDDEGGVVALARNKRARKPPSWMVDNDEFVVNTEDVPAPVAEGIQAAKQAAPSRARTSFGPTRFTKWRLLDRETMEVELEYGGKHYKGIMKRTGVSPTAGTVLQKFEPGAVQGPGTNNRDQCALCNLPLADNLFPDAPEELQKVVRVAISANWVAHVHLMCGMWAPEVYEDKHGNLINLSGAIRRARALKCMHCKQRGAGLCCSHRGCQKVLHLTCARQIDCHLDDTNFLMICPTHCFRKA